MGAVDARGIPRRANPLPHIRSWTPVDVGGAPLKPIRNQQVGGSSPPVGSNDFKGLRASRPTPEVAGKHMGSSRSGFGGPTVTAGTRNTLSQTGFQRPLTARTRPRPAERSGWRGGSELVLD